MRCHATLLLLLSLLAGGPASAASPVPSLAVVDISRPAGGEWSDSDTALIERLRRRLAQEPAWRLAADKLQRLISEPPPADWQARRDQGLHLLEQAEQHYRRLRPRKAIASVRAALALLQEVTPWLPDLAPLEQALLLLGATWQALGRNDQADQAYRTLLLLDPELVPDEARFNPLVVQRLEQLRRRLQAEARGSISFVSRPSGARVVVDGRPAGVTPVTVSGLAPGSHYAWLAAPGHLWWLGVVDVAPGRDTRQEVFLQPGRSLSWVRLLERLRQTGPTAAPAEDAMRLARALNCELVLLVAIEHLGARAVFQAALAERGSGRTTALGIFSGTADGITALVKRLNAWRRGERLPRPDLEASAGRQPEPLPSSAPAARPSWWRSWWFWTIIGAVVAGTAAGTTAALLSRQSGFRLEMVR